MVIFQPSRRPSYRKRPLSRWAIAGMLAILANVSSGVMQGTEMLPGLATLPAMAQGTAVSDAEIQSYAASVLEMDGPRTEAYTQIKNLLSQVNYDVNRVDMSCTNTRSINQVPRQVRSDVREIVVNYCNQARQIVESNGLTVRRFNEITEAHKKDPALAEQIRTTLIELQQAQQ